MSQDKTENIKKLIKNPMVTFALGVLLTYLILEATLIFAGLILVIGIALFFYRDRIDFNSLFQSAKNREKGTLNPCSECGSLTKHKKTCSQYGKSKEKTP
jgi:membrane-anchored glycerophosphoryl diester phosphodiesterase (GDPDase)